jgi:hypothetical protein
VTVSTRRILIEDTFTKHAEVDIEIDDTEYAEWLNGRPDTPAEVASFIQATTEYPNDLPEPDRNAWIDYDSERRLVRVSALPQTETTR